MLKDNKCSQKNEVRKRDGDVEDESVQVRHHGEGDILIN